MTFIRLDLDSFCSRSGANSDGVHKVLDSLPNGAWLAGGALRRTLTNKPLDSDFDFFFKSEEEFNKWTNELHPSFSMVKETKHHKQFQGVLPGADKPTVVQAIKFSYYKNVEEVLDSFDYTITQFALDGTDLVTTPEALWDLGRQKLAIHKVTFPVSTMRRMLKYGQQGFQACSGCMATLLNETATKPGLLTQLDVEYVD